MPRVRGRELALTLWQMRRDPLWPWVEAARTHGEIFEARLPGVRQFTLYRAPHVEHVLITNQDNYEKGPQHELMAAALGQGLVTSNGELWRRQRRLIGPMFAKRHVEAFTGHMTAAGGRLLAQWESAESVEVSEAMMGLALDVVGRALFGTDLAGATRDRIATVMRDVLGELLAAAYSPLIWAAYSLPGVTMLRALELRPVRQRRFRARIRELDGLVAAMIEAHRARDRDEDLLTLLLGARDEDTGQPMSERQVRDEVVTFLMAGHETIANALAWMWVLLSQHPEHRARLEAEIDQELGGRIPTFADVDRLPFTRAVIQETLRLYPPVWMTGRRARHDDVIDGVRIPSGAIVAILIYLTHRDPLVWPNPEAFDPRRFLSENVAGRPRGAHVPFTAGRRVCIGNTFATTEATILTAMIAQRYRLDLDPTGRVRPEPLLTLRPSPVNMRLQQR